MHWLGTYMYLRVYVESCAANDYLTIALFAIYDN